MGVELRDLPAPQRFTGSSGIVCAPAWRLPKEIEHKFAIERFVVERMASDFQASVMDIWELGGSYFTSTGVTPECVYPFCAQVSADSIDSSELDFYRLSDLLEAADQLVDAHLLIVLHRLAHALGEI